MFLRGDFCALQCSEYGMAWIAAEDFPKADRQDMMMQPRFFYFDLGKVVVDFDLEQMVRQIADAAGVSSEKVRDAAFGDGLMRRYETGELTSREFHQAFCRAMGSSADFESLAFAASDIFTLKLSVLPILAELRHAGHRLGLLSNTCEIHWQYCLDRFRMIADSFEHHVLSYRVGAMKPDPAIFHAAAKAAGVEPNEFFFVDDILENVEGARAAGVDAVLFTSAEQLAADLRARGVRFNY